MKEHWYMVTLVGQDQPGIVAHVTGALYEGGGHLGEASMMRLGGNFAIMLMVRFDGSTRQLQDLLANEADSFDLRLHVDRIQGQLHDHREPDVRISVYGADRAGIVAKVTGALAQAGLHILDLETDVGGSEDKPIYIMHMEGHAAEGIEAVRSALEAVRTDEGVDARLATVDTVIG